MKSSSELKQMHGVKYVERFERCSSLNKFLRLRKYMDFKPDHVVADFGCGNGLMMELAAPYVKSYIGVDFSEPFIEAAEKRKGMLDIKNSSFVCSDINSFCKDNTGIFDAGFAMDFSEHVYDEDWLKILKSIRQSLKERGKLYLHTPNADFFMEILKNKNFIFKQFPEHIAVRTPGRNIELLKNAGFSRVKLFFLPHYNILKYINVLSCLPVIGKYFKARIFIIAEK